MQGPRSHIIQAAPIATAEEAAAIAAALERFAHDTAPPPAPAAAAAAATPDRWTRAALLEGVAREPDTGVHPWMDPIPG